MGKNILIIILISIGGILILSVLYFGINFFIKRKKIELLVKKIRYIKRNYSFLKRYLSYIVLILSTIFLLISLLISLYSELDNKKNYSLNTNILFVLDVSKSMNSIDIENNNYLTTRLNFAKKAIKNYISKHSDYKYGLVIFTKQAQVVVPLTNDINIFSTLLEGVDYRNLTEQGTNFTNALKLAIERFKAYKGENVLVIISDGGDKGDYKKVNIEIPSNIKKFVFGIGTKVGGKIFLGENDFGEYIFQKYKGNYVITTLNEENLKQLAKDIGAFYFKLDNPNDLEIIDKYIKNKKQPSFTTNSGKDNDFITLVYLFKISLFLFLLSYLIFILKYENLIYVKKIILFIKESKKERKNKIIFTGILERCNIKLKSGVYHILLSTLTFGIYYIIYLYKRFKLRNCLVYKNKDCCNIKNIRNIIFLIFLILLFIGLTLITYLEKGGKIIFNEIAIILFILYTNIVIAILYISLEKNTKAKTYFSRLLVIFLIIILTSHINNNLASLIAILYGFVLVLLGIYGFFVDEKINKIIYFK